MNLDERKRRMRRMRRKIQKENVFFWCDSFCADLRVERNIVNPMRIAAGN